MQYKFFYFSQEHEAKINFLRKKADDRCRNETTQQKQTNDDLPDTSKLEHVNFFKNIEEDNLDYKKDNAEYLKEKKEEQEKYEKKIGYLTYLGQDTNEALGKKNWYDIAPDRQTSNIEVNVKSKIIEDPLQIIQKYTHVKPDTNKQKTTKQSISVYETYKHKSNKHKKKHKHKDSDDSLTKKHKSRRKRKRKRESSESEEEHERKKVNLEILRKERLERERKEKLRTEQLLAGNKELPKVQIEEKSIFKQKFNSQYNPDVAKQNYM